MASTGNLTITAPVKAGLASVADTVNDIRSITYDIKKEMIFVIDSSGRHYEWAYDTVATITHTIAAKVATITVST